MAKERSCIFCGKTYSYCPNCSDSSKYPTWMFNFCSDKCHDIYDVVAGYNMEIKTIDDVKKILDKYEVSDYSIFPKDLQDKLEGVASKKISVSENKEEESISRKIKKNNFERRGSIKE